MKKYIQYLLSDIEVLTEQAPPLLRRNTLHDDPEEEYLDIPLRYVKISELIGLKAEVFPPEHFLCDLYVIQLVEALNDLWNAWGLDWKMPPQTPFRTEYMTMVKSFDGLPIGYHPEDGGQVIFCHPNSNKPCHFKGINGTCFCEEQQKDQTHEYSLWEDYLRSQGLDPDQEITPEEEALFEAEMKHRRKSKETGLDKIMKLEFFEDDQEKLIEALEILDNILAHFDGPSDEFDLLDDDDQEEH